MGRLEAVEIRLSELKAENSSFRIDSEYLKKEYLKNINDLKSFSSGYFKLRDKIKHITGGATPLGAEYPAEGIPFLRVQNIMQNYFNLSDVVYISDKQDKEIRRSKLKKDDVLLTITGVSYGKSAVVPSSLINANINQHSVKMTLDANINPYFLSTFLNSKYGKLQSDKNIVGVTRPALDYEVIKNFIIPRVTLGFQKNIENIINKSVDITHQAKTLYTSAQTLLLSELGLADYTPSSEGVAVKTFAASFGASGRLDAEYYQPKYEEVERKISDYKNGFSYIKDKFVQNKRPYDVVSSEHKYIEIGDINISSGAVEYNIVSSDNLPSNAKIALNKGDLIYSTVRPYRGAVALCDFQENIVVSGAFTVLHEKFDYLRECLFVLLRTKVYQEYIMKYNVGSSYPIVKDDDVLNLKIPNLPMEIQQKIAEKVQQSFALRKKSAELLDCAKQAVEIAIEQGEDVALMWLEDRE